MTKQIQAVVAADMGTNRCRHTPGPWQYASGSVYQMDGAKWPEVRLALMDREELATSPTERDANARLMAAAPELLRELDSLRAQVECLNIDSIPPELTIRLLSAQYAIWAAGGS